MSKEVSLTDAVARALWFEHVDQHGYPNGMLSWDEMEFADRKDNRRQEFEELAQAAIKAYEEAKGEKPADPEQ